MFIKVAGKFEPHRERPTLFQLEAPFGVFGHPKLNDGGQAPEGGSNAQSEKTESKGQALGVALVGPRTYVSAS